MAGRELLRVSIECDCITRKAEALKVFFEIWLHYRAAGYIQQIWTVGWKDLFTNPRSWWLYTVRKERPRRTEFDAVRGVEYSMAQAYEETAS